MQPLLRAASRGPVASASNSRSNMSDSAALVMVAAGTPRSWGGLQSARAVVREGQPLSSSLITFKAAREIFRASAPAALVLLAGRNWPAAGSRVGVLDDAVRLQERRSAAGGPRQERPAAQPAVHTTPARPAPLRHARHAAPREKPRVSRSRATSTSTGAWPRCGRWASARQGGGAGSEAVGSGRAVGMGNGLHPGSGALTPAAPRCRTTRFGGSRSRRSRAPARARTLGTARDRARGGGSQRRSRARRW